jgi:hypothetical protein
MCALYRGDCRDNQRRIHRNNKRNKHCNIHNDRMINRILSPNLHRTNHQNKIKAMNEFMFRYALAAVLETERNYIDWTSNDKITFSRIRDFKVRYFAKVAFIDF